MHIRADLYISAPPPSSTEGRIRLRRLGGRIDPEAVRRPPLGWRPGISGQGPTQQHVTAAPARRGHGRPREPIISVQAGGHLLCRRSLPSRRCRIEVAAPPIAARLCVMQSRPSAGADHGRRVGAEGPEPCKAAGRMRHSSPHEGARSCSSVCEGRAEWRRRSSTLATPDPAPALRLRRNSARCAPQ